MLHVPDTGPGKRVPGAGARTEGREASRQSSEVGAVCRKAARTVLCGGRPVMGVPTAIATFGSLTGLRDTRSGQSSWVLSEFVSTHCTGGNFGFDFRLTGFDAWLSTAICCL